MLRKLNNKANTLLILIVAFLIVSIFASAAIHYSTINLQISRNTSNFNSTSYKAEEAMNIIRSGIENDCAIIINEQYNKILSAYSYIPYSERNILFHKNYLEELKDFYGNDGDKVKDKLLDYISKVDSIDVTLNENNNGIYLFDTAYISYDTSDEYNMTYTINDIRIQYIDKNKYKSIIGADIVIKIPTIFSTEYEAVSYETEYSDYILIADNSINFDVKANTDICGSIYAGINGINIGGTSEPTLTINSGCIHSRGDLNIKSGSTLNIDSYSNNSMCNVYVRNILASKSILESPNTNINIHAIMNIADDLEVNTSKANIKLSGEYYGYGKDQLDFSNNNYSNMDKLENKSDYTFEQLDNMDSDSKSSAIIINESNSILDLTRLSRLTLSGVGYIYPNKNNIAALFGNSDEIATSESLTAKFMQIIYMVPSSCISTGTNPANSSITSNITVDYTQSKNNGGLDLKNSRYDIDTTKEPISITVPSQDGNKLTYYFLRFKSKNGQQNYVRDFITLYEEYIQNKADTILLNGRVLLDMDTTVFTANGNIIDYEEDSEGNTKFSLRTYGAPEDSLQIMSNNLTAQANSKNSTLVLNQTSSLNEYLFKYLINEEHIRESGNKFAYYTLDDYYIMDMSDETKQNIKELKDNGEIRYDIIVYADTDTYNIPFAMNNGLVIALGDVTIDHDFTGCIISGGDITIKNGCKLAIESDNREENPLMYLLARYSDAETIKKFFNIFSNEDDIGVNALNINKTIEYKNWVIY